jgi:hypothetical protein
MTASHKDESGVLACKAIEHFLGDISKLPGETQADIIRVYDSFFRAYRAVADQKLQFQKPQGTDGIKLDVEILEYMQHFFSDYQEVYRRFKAINRHASMLMQIDPSNDPQRYADQLQKLKGASSIWREDQLMEALLSGASDRYDSQYP